MDKKLLYFCLSFCFFACGTICNAQKGFTGKIKAGLNASQIHGDQLFGYDKLGLNVGLQLSIELNSRFDLATEFLFSQKGSQSEISLGTPIDIRKTTLNYIEFPLILFIKDWYIEEEGYYKIKGHAGLSYGYLMDISSSNGLFENDIGNFKNYDLAFLVGVNYTLSKKWEAFARYTNSFTKIYKNIDLETDGLVNYLWTLGLEFKL